MSSSAAVSTPVNRPMYSPRPPPGIRRKIWRMKMWFESTFALSMMQPWEKAVIWGTILIITAFLWFSLYTYYPGHIAYLWRRFAYYVYDDENANVPAIIKEGIKEQAKRVAGEIKELMGAVGGRKVELSEL
ncbi:hypothetical protein IAT38_002859 [Cryptococcus sp. DSM 104549]